MSGSRSRAPINSVFAFRNQPDFSSQRNLHKVSILVFHNRLGLLLILHVCCFQVFQLTTLVMRGPSELHPVFSVSLNWVAINHEKVKGAVACVQEIVSHPIFTQRNFFSETGISMLSTAVDTADAIRQSSEFDPWGVIGVEAGPVIADLSSCREKIVQRRKAVKGTGERRFGAETVASSAVVEATPRTTAHISDVVEMGDVQYFEEHNKLGLPCCSRSL